MRKVLLTILFAIHNSAVLLASWVKREFIKIEVWIKSTAAVMVSGGIVALRDFYQHGKSFELTAAHLVQLKAQFVNGAVIALIMYWANSPFGKSKQ